MRPFAAILLALLFASGALAQDGPKAVRTFRITEPFAGPSTLYRLEEDGTVRIDWHTAELLARNKSDHAILPLVQMMLAIRDGTWKPMN